MPLLLSRAHFKAGRASSLALGLGRSRGFLLPPQLLQVRLCCGQLDIPLPLPLQELVVGHLGGETLGMQPQHH